MFLKTGHTREQFFCKKEVVSININRIYKSPVVSKINIQNKIIKTIKEKISVVTFQYIALRKHYIRPLAEIRAIYPIFSILLSGTILPLVLYIYTSTLVYCFFVRLAGFEPAPLSRTAPLTTIVFTTKRCFP